MVNQWGEKGALGVVPELFPPCLGFVHLSHDVGKWTTRV